MIQAIDDQLEDLANERRRLEAARACLTGKTVVQLGDEDMPKWTPTTEELQVQPPETPDDPADVHKACPSFPGYASGYGKDAVVGTVPPVPVADGSEPALAGTATGSIVAALAAIAPPPPLVALMPLVEAPQSVKDMVAQAPIGRDIVNPPIPKEGLAPLPAIEIQPPKITPKPEAIARRTSPKTPAPNHPWRSGPMPKPPPLPTAHRDPPSPPGYRGFYEPVDAPATISAIVESIMADGHEHTPSDIVARALELKKELHGPSVSTKLSEMVRDGSVERTAPGRFRKKGKAAE